MITFKTDEELRSLLKKNIRSFAANISTETEEKLRENTERLWYNEYNPVYYVRMGKYGGVLGAIKRTGVQKEGNNYYFGEVYIDPTELDMDKYTNKGKTFGRHCGTSKGGGVIDFREQLIDKIENTGLPRGHTHPAHMIEETANWLENKLDNLDKLSTFLGFGSYGMEFRLKKTK